MDRRNPIQITSCPSSPTPTVRVHRRSPVGQQHPAETDFAAHLKAVVVALRTAFPDLHFEVTQMIAEGEWVACYSVMTGTHLGRIERPVMLPPGVTAVEPTGRAIRAPHMHMIRFDDAGGDLLHLMDTIAMLGQLGLLPGGPPAA